MDSVNKLFRRMKKSIAPEWLSEAKTIKRVLRKSHPEMDPRFKALVPRMCYYDFALAYINNDPNLCRAYADALVELGVTSEMEMKILGYVKSSNLLYEMKLAGYKWSEIGVDYLFLRFPKSYLQLL